MDAACKTVPDEYSYEPIYDAAGKVIGQTVVRSLTNVHAHPTGQHFCVSNYWARGVQPIADFYKYWGFDYYTAATVTCPAGSYPPGVADGGSSSSSSVFSFETKTLACRCPRHAPANAAQTRCECPAGTQLNTAGTACVDHTLTLTNPPGDLEPTGITAGNPNSTKAMSVSVKSLSTGLPKNSAWVRVVLSAQPNASGGTAPLASLKGCTAASSAAGGYDCTTTATGYANFNFIAPSAPGNHTLTATCIAPACLSPQVTTVNVKCPAGMQPNAAGTACVEQYIIALSGLGGEVTPNATRAAYAQVTKSSDGSPKSGAQVVLSLTVIPEEDGYDHAIGHTAPHEGVLTPLSGTTGADGRLPFVFTAPSAGGTHTITATCTNCANAATDTITVPSCPIPPLTSPPFTDPVAEGFENGNRWRPDLLTPAYQEHLACVQNGITEAGGTYANGSAYRPTEYQQHLFEVVDKHRKLTKAGYISDHPECQALLNSVAGEMTAHSLRPRQPVAQRTSRHESGTAFDITPIGLTRTQMTPIYTSCGVTNTAVPGEAWHVQ